MERFSAKKLAMYALFAALACVTTMSIRTPTPGTSDYIHPGDAVVILCDIFMGPAKTFLATGIGSSMADFLGGYFIYVPITFVIKGLIVYLSSGFYRGLSSQGRNSYLAVAGCGIIDMAVVTGGYFLCEIFLYGTGAVLASVPSNLIQGAGGLTIAYTLYPVPYRPLKAAMVA